MAASDDVQVFMALTLIVIIICIILQPSVSTIIGLITCLGLSYQAMRMSAQKKPDVTPVDKFASSMDASVIDSLRHQGGDSDSDGDGDGDGDGDSDSDGDSDGQYQGAVELDGAINEDLEWPPTSVGDVNQIRNAGAFDRPAAAQETAGNFYNYGRSGASTVPEPCIDNEANADDLDADELNTYQARSRNDAVRVTMGTMNRQLDLQPYLREELVEAEARVWWGVPEQ